MPNYSGNGEFFQMGEEGNPPDAYELHITTSIKRLIYRDFVISNKYPNNIVLSKTKGVCAVSSMSYDESSDCFLVTMAPFHRQNDFFRGFPCTSSDFNIFQVSGGIDYHKKFTVASSDITNQFVCLLHDREVDKEVIQQQPNIEGDPAAVANIITQKKAHWVCIPLMHVQNR